MRIRRTYSPGQKELLRILIVEEKCVASQVAELTGIPPGTANSLAKKHGIAPSRTRRSSVDRPKIARQTAELRLKYFKPIKKLFG